jgi:PAT family beta-lactamase induction signal transducer AmpG
MIGATLTTRLAQDGIDKRTVTAFRTRVSSSTTSRCSGLDRRRRAHPAARPARPARVLAAVLAFAAIAAVVNLALADPAASIQATVIAAVLSASPAPPTTS